MTKKEWLARRAEWQAEHESRTKPGSPEEYAQQKMAEWEQEGHDEAEARRNGTYNKTPKKTPLDEVLDGEYPEMEAPYDCGEDYEEEEGGEEPEEDEESEEEE